jgi:hypothetical protein
MMAGAMASDAVLFAFPGLLLGFTSRETENLTSSPSARQPGLRGFSLFYMTDPIASSRSVCRVGFSPTGKHRFCTAHAWLGIHKHLESIAFGPID